MNERPRPLARRASRRALAHNDLLAYARTSDANGEFVALMREWQEATADDHPALTQQPLDLLDAPGPNSVKRKQLLENARQSPDSLMSGSVSHAMRRRLALLLRALTDTGPAPSPLRVALARLMAALTDLPLWSAQSDHQSDPGPPDHPRATGHVVPRGPTSRRLAAAA